MMNLREMWDEFCNTYEEWHYLVCGLCIGFVLGWISFAVWYSPPSPKITIVVNLRSSGNTTPSEMNRRLDTTAFPEREVLISATSTTTTPTTSTTTTTMCGGLNQTPCRNGCAPGYIEGSDGRCHILIQGNTTYSGREGCGGWALRS